MNDTKHNAETTNTVEAGQENSGHEEKARRPKPMYIALSILALVLLGVGALVWYRASSGDAGRPVPAPRGVSVDEAEGAGETVTGRTVSIPAAQIETAGIKIETVGEQLAAESAETAATGVVQANSYRETPAISLAGGVVRRVEAELGETVARGETVAVVFSDEYAEAQSRFIALTTQVNNARQNVDRRERLAAINQPGRTEYDEANKRLKIADAELDEHHQHHDRIVKLVRIGAASREELEQATTKLKTAEAETEEARRRLERARQLLAIRPETRTELEEASNALRTAESERAAVRQKLLLYGMSPQRIDALRSVSQINSEIAVTAPAPGTVTTRSANVGEVIEANKEIVRVTDLSEVWVIAQVFEGALVRLRTGSGASVTTDAYPEQVFRGRVTYIDPRLDEATRTAQVRVELGNPGRALKIGMYVRVAFGALGTAERTAPVVPAAAVQTIGGQRVVFVATATPGLYELRAVRVGEETNGQYAVFEGLTVGERIVTDGSFMLRAEYLKSNPGGN